MTVRTPKSYFTLETFLSFMKELEEDALKCNLEIWINYLYEASEYTGTPCMIGYCVERLDVYVGNSLKPSFEFHNFMHTQRGQIKRFANLDRLLAGFLTFTRKHGYGATPVEKITMHYDSRTKGRPE